MSARANKRQIVTEFCRHFDSQRHQENDKEECTGKRHWGEGGGQPCATVVRVSMMLQIFAR